MTVDVSAYTMRCGASPDCFHPVCPCGNRIRTSGKRLVDHPGTVQGSLKRGQCQNCMSREYRRKKRTPSAVSIDSTRAGLNRFLQARYERLGANT